MYGLVDYGAMLQDQVRLQAMLQALRQAVPGKRVLEIGGGTGFFACVASRFGASQVTSIDLNPLIRLGPNTAIANRAGNIHFFMGRSQEYRSEEPFDVLFHDLRGTTPYFEGSLATLLDARRLINKNSVMLPNRDTVYAALVEDQPFYQRMEGIWGGKVAGIDLSPFRSETHRMMRYDPTSESRHWGKYKLADIDYRTFQQTNLDTTFQFQAEFDGKCHGLVIWFETSLFEEIGYSTDPWLPAGQRATTYGVSFLPWPRPVDLVTGASFSVEVQISATGEYATRLFSESGSIRKLIGRFATNKPGKKSFLPLDAKFEKRPDLKPYRIAMRALERGLSVEMALKEIQQSADIQDRQTAMNILFKCKNFTQSATRLKRSLRKILAFSDLRLEIQTWDQDLQDAVLAKLAPSWKAIKRTTLATFPISLERATHTTTGAVILVKFREDQTVHNDLAEALNRVEDIVTTTVLPASQKVVVMDCGYFATSEGITLLLDDNKAKRRQALDQTDRVLTSHLGVTILNKSGRWVPYSTEAEDQLMPTVASIQALLFLAGSAPNRAFAITFLLGHCRNNCALKNPLKFFTEVVQEATIAGTEVVVPSTESETEPEDESTFPWYDSIWLRQYRKTQRALSCLPDKLRAFNEAMEIFKTPQNFLATKLTRPALDARTLDECRQVIRDLPGQLYETHEFRRMGRLVVHDHPFFNELQATFVNLVSEIAGEPVEPLYNFLSLYKDMGDCGIHLDAPEAKWTLDICLEQSDPWPIGFSQVRPWPEFGDYSGSDWAQHVRNDPANEFSELILHPGEGLIFSGSGQWHYRDPIPRAKKENFCHLIFFHYIPRGTRELVRSKNWIEIFGLPFDPSTL